MERYPDLMPDTAAQQLLDRMADNGTMHIYNIDMPDVIAVRNELLPESGDVKNIACNLNVFSWFDRIDFRKEGLA